MKICLISWWHHDTPTRFRLRWMMLCFYFDVVGCHWRWLSTDCVTSFSEVCKVWFDELQSASFSLSSQDVCNFHLLEFPEHFDIFAHLVPDSTTSSRWACCLWGFARTLIITQPLLLFNFRFPPFISIQSLSLFHSLTWSACFISPGIYYEKVPFSSFTTNRSFINRECDHH